MQLKDLSQQTQRYADDPAFTEDVRHLAFPMRRNSGPESARRKSCSLLDSKLFDCDDGNHNKIQSTTNPKQSNATYKYDVRTKNTRHMDKKYAKKNRVEDSTSSDDSSSYNRRGQSLDRNIYRQQKKMLCFQREKDSQNRRFDKSYQRKAFSKENLLKSPHSTSGYVDEIHYPEYFANESHRSSRTKERFKQLSALPLSDRKYSSLSRGEAHSFEQLDRPKLKEISKFQIGKRFLKGEIGIKSFNYYLIKEGLKSTKKTTTKSSRRDQTHAISKSEENIYEEIYFTEKQMPKNLISYPDCELCIQECTNKNCDICKASEQKNNNNYGKSLPPSKSKTPIEENRLVNSSAKLKSSNSNENLTNISQQTTQLPNVLQYQSYNPNNPGVYKVETTPVAFTSDYNPIEGIYNSQKYAGQHKSAAHKVSSSSSDSLHHQKLASVSIGNNYYDCSTELFYAQQNQLKPQIYKTDSKASILSEMSIKSENSTNRYYKPAEMSDSSMGDSLFSYPAQRRYYGSAESCRFGYECRRCSYDGDKCSFSDNCRYECRNCDCSSSYFSSDFDDGNFSRKSSTRMSNNSQVSYYDDSHAIDSKTTRYAEDFIMHLNNVKKTCNYQTMHAGNHTNASGQNDRSQQIKSCMNSLPKETKPQYQTCNEYGSLSKQKPQKPTRQSATDTNTKGKEISSESMPKKAASCSSKSSSSSKSEINNSKSGQSTATGTIPKSGKNQTSEVSVYQSTAICKNKIEGENKTNYADQIDGLEYCIEDCECCRKSEMNTELKTSSCEDGDDIHDDVFEADTKIEIDTNNKTVKFFIVLLNRSF